MGPGRHHGRPRAGPGGRADLTRVLAYLSGAPRVSTRPEVETSGPRAHVLGVIAGFRALDWQVRPYILGDQLPAWVSSVGSEQLMAGGGWRTLLADAVRVCLRPLVPTLSWLSLGTNVSWAYERFSLMQQLGRSFQRRGVPWILETNSLASREAFGERQSLRLHALSERFERRAYLECDVLVCVSDRLRQLLAQEMQIPQDKIVVVPVGIDPSLHAVPPAPRPDGAGPFTIGFVGRLYRWQALETLMHGARIARQRGAPELHIVVIGGGLAERDVRRAAESVGPAVTVEFVGQVPVDRVASELARADVAFVGPKSIGEQGMYFSPIKLLEYMVMAKPVLCANYESLTKLVQEGETGFLFEPEDPGSLAEAILRAIRARGRLAQLGQQARRIVLRSHTWQQRVSDMVGHIEAILARPAASAS